MRIVVQTFGVGCFIYSAPDSAENLLLWPTGRGNYLRDGRPWRSSAKGDIDGDQRLGLAVAVYLLEYLVEL